MIINFKDKDKTRGFYVQPPLLAIGFKLEQSGKEFIVYWYLKKKSQMVSVDYTGGMRTVRIDPPLDAGFDPLPSIGPINQLDAGLESDNIRAEKLTQN